MDGAISKWVSVQPLSHLDLKASLDSPLHLFCLISYAGHLNSQGETTLFRCWFTDSVIRSYYFAVIWLWFNITIYSTTLPTLFPKFFSSLFFFYLLFT